MNHSKACKCQGCEAEKLFKGGPGSGNFGHGGRPNEVGGSASGGGGGEHPGSFSDAKVNEMKARVDELQDKINHSQSLGMSVKFQSEMKDL